MIAIFLVAVFILLSVGMGSLILQSSINIATVEMAHKSFYGAESGVELSLLSLKKHYPGYQENNNFSPQTNMTVSYSIASQTNRIPKPNDNTNAGALFQNKLQPNQIVHLALFKDIAQTPQSQAQIRDLTEVGTSFQLDFASESAQAGQCLRWSIFGFKKDATDSVTESMGGYAACDSASSLGNSPLAALKNGQFKNNLGDFYKDYPIDQFIDDHYQNYITLSNITGSTSDIVYSLVFEPEAMADEKYLITATGTFKNYAQTEQVVVPQGELSPAFFFSIVSPSSSANANRNN